MKHLLIFCPKFSKARAELTESVGHTSFQSMLSDRKHIVAVVVFALRHFDLVQFQSVRERFQAILPPSES